MTMARWLCGLLALMLMAPAMASEPKLPVVASFSIVGDLVRQVGGDAVSVQMLVGPDSDAHAVQPTPAMARSVAGAALLFSHGLGFEGWMARFLRAAGFRGLHVEVAQGIAAIAAAGAPGHGHEPDPHAWQDVRHAMHYVARIADGLCAANAPHCAGYRSRAAALTLRLQALDAEIRAGWATVPAAQRVVITTHEAFGYYAAAYGVRFLAAQGLSSAAEPSPRAVAALVRQVRSSGSRALFLERTGDTRLMQRIAQETGVAIGGTLYADALSGPDGPAPTYEALMRHNTQTLLRALSPR
ncbi:MAG: zinc ABC transporter substrate-binding protein [Rubrivivax sp.]|nr:zinc ABC transporter substrate-binding protein [Rubrivivax sp.]